MKTPEWRPHITQAHSEQMKALLSARGLLTLKLSAQCGAPLSVQILHEGLGYPLADEREALNIPKAQQGWIRVVQLNCRHTPMLYARTFIPLTDEQQSAFLNNQHPLSALKNLGDQPLGLWLAKNPMLNRTPFVYAQCDANYWPHWPAHSPSAQLNARQSIFTKEQSQFVLTEVFLT